MALDFPNSPTIGDEFTGGGFTWVWTGSSWDKVMAATSSGNGFSLIVGVSGNTTYAFSTPQPAGAYSFTSELADNTFDIYLISPTNTNVGYASATSALEASGEFDRVVLYGATTNDIINFEFKPSASPATSGDVVDGAAPFLTSATPAEIPGVDDTTTVTGGNFATDVEIVFTGQDAVERPAKSIVRSSSTSLIVTRPDDMPTVQNPFTMKATNPGIPSPSTNVNKLTDYFTSSIATGGTVVESGGYVYHTFLASGTFTLGLEKTVEYMIVAGGGGGSAGGGGAGGLLGGSTTLTSGDYAVTVGAGGAFRNVNVGHGFNGSNSVFGVLTAIGGGGGGAGGNVAPTGLSGGSGGGGGTYGANSGGAGTSGQGFAGGAGAQATFDNAGGGGGAGAAGSNAIANTSGGAGGVGSSVYSAWGSATGTGELVSGTYFYAGGGGGGTQGSSSGFAVGGNGGGADGSAGGDGIPNATAAIANTGGGGGGNLYTNNGNSTSGASGIVIVRYAV